jgi:septal ring factor EnvC (AmiA/AmiB activator)
MSDDPTKELPGDEPLLNKDSEHPERVRSESNPPNVIEESFLKLSEQIKKIDEKVDARLHDTRPIWEAVQSQLTILRTDSEAVQSQLTTLQTEWEAVQAQLTTLRADMEKGFRRLDHKIDLFAKNLADVYADQKDLEDRVDKLEEKAS